MKIVIDQSGKIEQTSKPTVIAFSNGLHGGVYVPAKEKRRVLQLLRKQSLQHYFPVHVFAVVVLLVIKQYQLFSQSIMIDTEYTGKDSTIRDFLVMHGMNGDRIQFGFIGKKSTAHVIALKMFRDKKGVVISAEQIISFFSAHKKRSDING